MKTITTREQIKELQTAIKEVVDANFELSQKLDRQGRQVEANLIRLMTDSIKEDQDELEQISNIVGYLEQSAKDLEWYSTRREPRNFETQIKEIHEYRESAQYRKGQLVATWNTKRPEKQIEL